MYSKEFRSNVQDVIIDLAKRDKRITDCAVVGSEAISQNDDWSDIDLTFGVSDDVDITVILSDWNCIMAKQFDAHVLFDLPHRQSIYRVYLLPNALQVDLSFTPTKYFGALTKKFKLIYGNVKRQEIVPIPEYKTIYGYAVLYALKTRCALERMKVWQSYYYLGKYREYIMQLKCIEVNVDSKDGRGYGDLPTSFLTDIQQSLTSKMDTDSIRDSLSKLTKVFLRTTHNNQLTAYSFENELMLIAGLSQK